METISGTQGAGNPPRGFSWFPGAGPVAVEPGGVDLRVVITAMPSVALEWRASGGAWTLLAVGQSISRGGGERVELRPATGEAAVAGFAWSGSALEELRRFNGSKGSRVSWG